MPKRKEEQQDAEVGSVPKRSRPDVADRNAANKSQTAFTVKMKLNSFVTALGKLLDIETWVLEGNKAVYEAWLLANAYVATACARGIAVKPLNQDFFYQCLAAVSVSTVRKKGPLSDDLLEEVARAYRQQWGANYTPADSTHLSAGPHNYCSQLMATNTQVRDC